MILAVVLALPLAAAPPPGPTLDADDQAHRALVQRHNAKCATRWAESHRPECEASQAAVDSFFDELERQKKPGQPKDKSKKDAAHAKAKKAVEDMEKSPPRTPTPTPQ